MQIAKDGVDFVAAPKDYAELFRNYYDFVVSLVHKYGIDNNRKEDVACEILLRFYELRKLEQFDPSLVFVYDGVPRPARFKSFLSKFVITCVQGHRDRQRRVLSRELLIMDMPLPGEFTHGWSTWGTEFGGAVDGPDVFVVEDETELELRNRIRAHLATVPRRSMYDTCDLVKLFDVVIRQIHENGNWDVRELRQIFGVSSTAMHTWLWLLRTHIAQFLGLPVPKKRPRSRG